MIAAGPVGRRPWPRWIAPIAVLAAVAATACVGGGQAAGDPPPAPGVPRGGQLSSGRLSGPLRVFAAASLTEPFTALGAVFEAAHPGVDVRFTFAASSALARQIADGAAADVFASADRATMAELTGAGHALRPRVVARNRPAVIVEPGNPRGITGVADLDRPGLVVILCAPDVPCGRAAAAVLRRAGVAAAPASLEENVKAVVSRVTLGEADAGIVYATDVLAAGGRAAGIEIDTGGDPELEVAYPMAVTTGAAHPSAGDAWANFVLSGAAQRVMRRHGFLAP